MDNEKQADYSLAKTYQQLFTLMCFDINSHFCITGFAKICIIVPLILLIKNTVNNKQASGGVGK